jgi:hypothetical protein
MKVTDPKLLSLKPVPQGKRIVIWDKLVEHFAVRVTDKGRVSFYLITRLPRSKHTTPKKIGDYPKMKLTDARDEARK